MEATIDYHCALEQKIRVIGCMLRTNNLLTRLIEDIKPHRKLSVCSKNPLIRLAWDIANCPWIDSFTNKKLKFSNLFCAVK